MGVEEQSNVLNNQFSSKMAELYDIEKRSVKLYQKMAKAAYTTELQTALSPSSTESRAHLQRLKLIMESQHIKPIKTNDLQNNPFPDLVISTSVNKRKKDMRNDSTIIFNVMVIQKYKEAIYDFLYLSSIALQIEQPSSLLAQCITDHKNTYAWLTQILQNIVNPEINE